MPGLQAPCWFVEAVEHPHVPLRVACDDAGRLTCVHFDRGGLAEASVRRVASKAGVERVEARRGGASEAARQLRAYLEGALHHFDLELAPSGTPFELAAWAALREIPFGQTRSYAEQAARLDKSPAAARAVGRANAANPIAIVIPCHRVIGKDGSLTGFAGGLEAKAWLLAHESRQGDLFLSTPGASVA